MTESKDTQTTITINSYQKVWNYEKRVYQLVDKIPLPVSVGLWEAIFFVACLAVVWVVTALLRVRISNMVWWMLVYIGIPLGGTAVLRYQSFDGKNPLVFISDYLRFLCSRSKQYEYFIPVIDQPMQLAVWRVGYRHRLRLKPSAHKGGQGYVPTN